MSFVDEIIDKINEVMEVAHSIASNYNKAEEMGARVSKYLKERVRKLPFELDSISITINTDPTEILIPNLSVRGFRIYKEKFDNARFSWNTGLPFSLDIYLRRRSETVFEVELHRLGAKGMLFLYLNKGVIIRLLEMLKEEFENQNEKLEELVEEIAKRIAEILV